MLQQLLNRPHLNLLMRLITGILIIMTIVKLVKLLSYYLKNVIGLQKINKINKKHFGVHPTP